MDRLTSLRVFQTIGETGSFSAAAERLGLSAAMASKHVHALEQQLGTRLFQRTTRRVSLTEAGQDYARRIALVLAQLEEADAAAMQQSVDIRGRVRLSAPISFGMRVLGGWLAALSGWPAIFYFLTGFGVLLVVLSLLGLPETLPQAWDELMYQPAYLQALDLLP